jgi:(2Fe-2S) ferredoxin
LAEDDRGEPASHGERQYRVHLCFGPNCTDRGSRALWAVLEQAVAESRLGGRVELFATTCRNRCAYGPSLNVYPGPVFYNEIDAGALREVVSRHLMRGEIVERCLFRPNLERARRR